MEKLTVTIPEACKIIGVGRSTIYRLFDDGELTRYKLGHRTLIKMADLHNFVDSMAKAQS